MIYSGGINKYGTLQHIKISSRECKYENDDDVIDWTFFVVWWCKCINNFDKLLYFFIFLKQIKHLKKISDYKWNSLYLIIKILEMQNCLECGDQIIGRSDKKFCNDGCRNAYNNKHNRDSSNLMRNINNKLRKNHRILNEQKFVDGKAKTTRNKLTSEGFDFEYFTSLKIYKNGAEYRFVYDIGYKLLEEDWILLVRKE